MTETPRDKRSVVVEREIAHSPEKIWRALTQPHLLEEWLMKSDSDFKPVVGHRFVIRRNPKPDLNIAIDCEVLVVEPNKTLAYKWDALGLETVVTFTLVPTSTGTHLRMEQSGFGADNRQALAGATGGWLRFFAELEKALDKMD
jgi:uncharacterized protein YndB with AHSA1/START domain